MVNSTQSLIPKIKKLIENEQTEEALDLTRENLKKFPLDLKLLSYNNMIETFLLHQYLEVFTLMESIPKITPHFSDKLTQLNLKGHEGYLLTQIDGKTNIKSLLYICGLGKFTTLRILNKFLTDNIITIN